MSDTDRTLTPAAPESHERPPQVLRVRRRQDLLVVQTGTLTAPRWTIKDPVSLRFYQLREADYFVFSHLDGQTTVEEIQEKFHRQYAPEKLAPQTLIGFVHRLWNQGLVTVDQFGISKSLAERKRRIERRRLTQALSSILVIRFRGFDPDRLLGVLSDLFGWMFSKAMVVLALVLMTFSIGLVLTEWEQLIRDLPSFQTLLRFDHLGVFVLAFAVVKILHELGHGIVCKKLGGECRELGIMLLALTPCLYCNVSDAWLLKNRWHRAAIGAAGIYVELVLAAICVWLWHWSRPGTFHAVCLDVMVICSLNTLLINGNPLLRYDGYYVLADLVNIPNLRSRSQQLSGALFTRIFFGVSTPIADRRRPMTTVLMTLYGILAGLYTWFVVFAILWMFYKVAETRNLESAVVALGTLLIVSRLWTSISQWFRKVMQLHREGRLRVVRFLIAGAISGGLAYALLTMPIERQIRAPLLVQPVDPVSVFATAPGQIESDHNLSFGDTIAEKQPLVALSNLEVAGDLTRLRGVRDQQIRRIELLESRRRTNPRIADQLPAATSALADYNRRLEQREQEARRLIVTAPTGGVLLPHPAYQNPVRSRDANEATRDPFADRNLGAWLEVGSPICLIADPLSREAVLYVDQAEITSVPIGAEVELVIDQTAGRLHRGIVTEVASQAVGTLPNALALAGTIPVMLSGDGQVEPIDPVHEVRVTIEDANSSLVLDQEGRATISLGRETPFERLIRFLRKTLTFEL